jgi:DNA-binding MarR family transcriptional regulator
MTEDRAPSPPAAEAVNSFTIEVGGGALKMAKDLNTNLRFGFLVHDVSRLRRIVVDRALKPSGITRSQWWVLAFLSRRDGMTQRALATDLDVSTVAIGKFVDRLETLGFVERRLDAQDARVKRVYLAKTGTKMVNTIRDAVNRVEEEIVSRVTESELGEAAGVLLKIKETLLDLAGTEASDGDEDNELLLNE